MTALTFHTYAKTLWRVVESQTYITTRGLVDTNAEHDLLEALLDSTKPYLPENCRSLDYLMSTPFRYRGEYPHGSRFRRAGHTLGVYYASESVKTALCEMIYYRLRTFLDSTVAFFPKTRAEYTAIATKTATNAMVDLTIPPLFSRHEDWTSPCSYEETQRLADLVRLEGGEIIRYQSVRDPEGGMNLAILTPDAFASQSLTDAKTWSLSINQNGAWAMSQFPKLNYEWQWHFDETSCSARFPVLVA